MPIELLLVASGVLAGGFGALLGLGGGILIVPILTLGFGVPLPAAVGTSLICVVATSSGAAAVNVRAARADVRLGILLAGGTLVGALVGGIVAAVVPERLVAGLFALLLAYTAFTMARGLRDRQGVRGAPSVDPDASDGAGAPAYRSRRRGAVLAGSFVAGTVSALLGVGGGVITVPLIHLVMGAPMQVAVATSNFVMGSTAAVGAYAYLFRGDVGAAVAGPVVLGVAVGAIAGASLGGRIRATWLVGLFVVVVIYVAARMAILALSTPA